MNREIIIASVIKKLNKKKDLFDLYWEHKPKSFNAWTKILKDEKLYSLISIYLSVYTKKENKESFDSLYKEISRLISYHHFGGMKREQAAWTFLNNKNYTEIIKARTIEKKYDEYFKVDIVAFNEKGIQCAFQVKGEEALSMTDDQKQELLSHMKMISKELPVEKYFLIFVPSHKWERKINMINLEKNHNG